jgi:hypothetical protein
LKQTTNKERRRKMTTLETVIRVAFVIINSIAFCTVCIILSKWLRRIEDKTDELKEAREARLIRYKDEPYKCVNMDREVMRNYILSDLTIPQISEKMPEYSYEQVYDTILCDREFNSLYRRHGQLKLIKNNK